MAASNRALVTAAAMVLALACAPPANIQTGAPADGEGAEILWDTYGVPHVFARDRNAAAYALGWAQMRNHGDLVLRLYAQARGNAAEILGQPYLEEDRWIWTMGIPQRADAWLAEQDAETRAHLDAFVRGINAFASAHPGLIGDSLRGVLPVREADVIAHGQRLMLSAFVTSRTQVNAQTRSWMERGSNAWAVAPSRSASGHALLLANPHLPWGDLFTWLEVQIVIPGLNLSGGALVGSPVLLIGFNDRLGWTHTVNTQDGEDLYELTLSGTGYVWDGGVRDFETQSHVLRVRLPDGTLRPDTLQVRHSVHGPVVAVKDRKALALRTVADRSSGYIRQWWAMGSARSLAEFREAIRPNLISTQNIIYADADGHIMYFYGGNSPIRSVGDRAYWAGVAPGVNSSNLWTNVHPFDDMPLVVDPPSGWIQNANNPPWWTTFPVVFDRTRYPGYLASTEMSLRAQRSAALVEAAQQMTLERMVLDKHSTEMELAHRVLPDLIGAARQAREDLRRNAGAVLESWDRRSDGSSTGAVLFVEWWSDYATKTRGRSPFTRPWNVSAPRATPYGIADTAAAGAALESAAQRVVERYGRLDVPWGDVYRVRRDTLDLPGNGAPHDFGVFRMTSYRPVGNQRLAASGDSYVAAIEFGPTVRAMSLLGYGNASRAGSPHRTDQLRLYSEQRLKPVWRTRAEVEQNTASREAF
jgi:acyl-homoserine-lactone acylase